jgi:hypothetical protein
VHALRLGGFALAGFPCDLGVEVALAVRAAAARAGGGPVMITSQTGGYAGYAHHPEACTAPATPAQRGLARYENAMGFFGWGFGRALEQAAGRALADAGAGA